MKIYPTQQIKDFLDEKKISDKFAYYKGKKSLYKKLMKIGLLAVLMVIFISGELFANKTRLDVTPYKKSVIKCFFNGIQTAYLYGEKYRTLYYKNEIVELYQTQDGTADILVFRTEKWNIETGWYTEKETKIERKNTSINRMQKLLFDFLDNAKAEENIYLNFCLMDNYPRETTYENIYREQNITLYGPQIK